MTRLILLVAVVGLTGCVRVKHRDFSITSFLRKSQIESATVTTNGLKFKGYTGSPDAETFRAIAEGVAAGLVAGGSGGMVRERAVEP